MKTIATALFCASIALATGGAAAQDATKKNDSVAKDGTKSSMTMQECKAHMEMSKKGEMKKDDDPMMKMCADMMKKEGKAGASSKK